MVARPRGRQLNVIQQAVCLHRRFPHERPPTVKAGLMTWTVTLQPTPMSVHYQVVISYRHRQRPRVKVVAPALESRQDESLPHVYPGDELCLYYMDEFTGTEDFIADTIVPWTSEWLYFYECWITTGVWLGAEAPHETGAAKR